MKFLNNLNISGTGLTAERLRVDIISENIANANTTRTSSGSPYRRKIPVFRAMENNDFEQIFSDLKGSPLGSGVEVVAIEDDMSEFKREYNPRHPDADENGFLLLPNVDIVSEMINLISASRAYEANTTVIKGTKDMVMSGLKIGE